LTHPDSEKGKEDRRHQHDFVHALQDGNLGVATDMLLTKNDDEKQPKSSSFLSCASLVLQHGFLSSSRDKALLLELLENSSQLESFLAFVLALLPPEGNPFMYHPLMREIKLQLATLLREQWFPLYDKNTTLRIPLLQWARVCCNACEDNKKVFVQAAVNYSYSDDETKRNGLDLLLASLPKTIGDDENTTTFTKELCKLIAILGKFQAEPPPPSSNGQKPQEPLVSSAHANVKELHRCGAVPRLHSLAQQQHQKCTSDSDGGPQQQELLCAILSALRVMAIDNDIVQNMVAVGILDTVNASLLVHNDISAPLAAATLGLIRNLCANDEIKSSICKQSLSAILHAMESHSLHALVQEHGCGILAAMALRQPHNAVHILEANGAYHIVQAMQSFPNKVPLQRQGCLAMRNMAVRLDDSQKQVLLDAGAEFVLRTIAAKHQDSIDEAYAALRDLGLAAVMYKIDETTGKAQGTQVFGTVKSNFRPVYD
jgi:hypothetical protein